MKSVFIIGLFLLCVLGLTAQNTLENTEGTISFISSQNVYIKFKSTEGLLIGDTLFVSLNNQLVPAIVVNNLSSTSIVGSSISLINFELDDQIIAMRRVKSKTTENSKPLNKDTLITVIDTSIVTQESPTKKNLQEISGRIGISSFSNFSNTPVSPSLVINYSLSLTASKIKNSNFSFENNIVFRQENINWKTTKARTSDGLKIYNLSIKYNFSKNSFMLLGRKSNSKISSLGSLDGLQLEKSFGNVFVGAFAGARPDYYNYNFNFNLLQYGAYFGHAIKIPTGSMQNVVALVEQTNKSKTDRRFLSFQHNNTLIKNISIFYSLELDLYKVINETQQNAISLTNNYFSIRYQPNKRLTLSGSYDSRKNIIYYETEKSYLNNLITSEARQGIGAQVNYKIAKNLLIGVKGGTHFQQSNSRKANNAYGFITYNNMLKSSISATFSTTILETKYLRGDVYKLNLSRGFNDGKTFINLGYSYVNYQVFKAEYPLLQHIVEANISQVFKHNIYLSLNFESNFENINHYYRAYASISKRF